MTYELIGTPAVQDEYSDEYETVMTVDVRRSDGEDGPEVWIVAGVPDHLQGTAKAAGHQTGLMSVRVFGDNPACWCPDSLRPEDGNYRAVADAIIEAVHDVAIATHRAAAAR
jgi:hypothetical protein